MKHPDDLTPNYLGAKKTPSVGSIKRVRIFKCHGCGEEFTTPLSSMTRVTVYCKPCRDKYLAQLDFSDLVKLHGEHALELLIRAAIKVPQTSIADAMADVLEIPRRDMDMLILKHRKYKTFKRI